MGRPSTATPIVILDAALAIAAEEGLDAASLGRVAKRAGTSKASVVYHFGSLVGLRRQLAVRVRERMQDLIFHAAAGAPGELVARGGAIFDALFSAQSRELLVASYQVLGIGARDPVVAAEVKANLDRATWIVAMLLGPPLDSALATAECIFSAVTGCIDVWICSGDEDPTPYKARAVHMSRVLVERRTES